MPEEMPSPPPQLRSGGAGRRSRHRARPWIRGHRAEPRPGRGLGPGRRLPDDDAQRARLHEPVLVGEAGDLQGARLLRRRRHRHGAVLGPARDRGRREDRLPAGAGLGRTDDGDVGAPDRRGAGQAPAAHRRLDRRHHGGRVGARRRGRARGRARRALRGAARARRAAAGQPARDAQAARQPDGRRAGPPRDARSSARSSTGSRATRPRASSSPAARPRAGFKQAVRERDEPFGDFGLTAEDEGAS